MKNIYIFEVVLHSYQMSVPLVIKEGRHESKMLCAKMPRDFFVFLKLIVFIQRHNIYIYYDSLFMDRACTTIKMERHLDCCLGIHPGPWDTAQKILNGRLEKLAQSVKNCHRTKHSLVLLHRFPTIYFKPKGGSPKKYQVSSWFANFRVYWNHVKLMTSTFSHCFNW